MIQRMHMSSPDERMNCPSLDPHQLSPASLTGLRWLEINRSRMHSLYTRVMNLQSLSLSRTPATAPANMLCKDAVPAGRMVCVLGNPHYIYTWQWLLT
jgi:hypothetical protein